MPMLSYKAGRAIRRSEDSNWVDPVPEKGTLAFEVVDDLAQLVWTSREAGSNTEREEYLLFPEDVQVEAVSSDPTGRTYVFKFSSSDQRLFYWFQDIDSNKYPEFANKINEFLASPDSHSAGAAEPAPQPALAAAAATSISTDSSQPPLSTATGIPQTPAPNPTVKSSTTTTATTTLAPGAPRANRIGQLMGLEGARGEESTPSSGRGQAASASASASASTTATATGSTAGAQAHQFTQDQLGALAALLGGSQAGNAGTNAAGYPGLQEDAHLSDILTASTITPILLSNPALITRLIPHLPADLPLSSPPTASEIQELISTPQWTEAVAAFDAALRTGGLQGVMPSLGLKERAGNGVREFLEEVQEAAEGKKEDKMDTE